MALRNQPYLPLFVKDVLTDEKLLECSASTYGIYFMLLCILHRQETYGQITLKAKHKQNEDQISNFAFFLQKYMPFTYKEIYDGLSELIEEKVCNISGDTLSQKRMVKDGDISDKRSLAGTKGGKNNVNIGTKKLYNEPGYFYLIQSVKEDRVFKVGISKNPKIRLLSLASKLDKKLLLCFKIAVDDMGNFENEILNLFNDVRDGEWILGLTLENITSKIKANSEYEIEYENEIIVENKNVKKIDEDLMNLDLPFSTESFFETWVSWIDARRKMKKPIKTVAGAKLQLKNLKQWAKGDESMAVHIIETSIANEWQGLFEPKNKQHGFNSDLSKDIDYNEPA